MRLALITETFLPDVNGVSKTLGHLCRGLLARGVEVDLGWLLAKLSLAIYLPLSL